jgi:hypothetical protein
LSISYAEPDQKKVQLEDIERDNLDSEQERQSSKEIEAQPATNLAVPHNQYQVQYVPQDIYVTPPPNVYGHRGNVFDIYHVILNITVIASILGEQHVPYHLPKVHEGDRTYAVPARQSLFTPYIGGGLPISPAPQPQYIYVQAQPQGQPQAQGQVQQQQQPPQDIQYVGPPVPQQQYIPQQP